MKANVKGPFLVGCLGLLGPLTLASLETFGNER